MRVERLDDAADARLHDFTNLRDVEMRSAREPAEGMFLAEGEKTMRRALDAGYELRAVVCTERWLGSLERFVPDPDAVAFVVNDEVLTRTTGFPVHRGAIASFARRPLPDPQELLDGARRAVVLEDVQDHTNVGAIFRSAAALGVDAVLLTPRTADPLYRRATRTSMGAVFVVPWTRIDWHAGPRTVREAGFTIAALTPAADAASLRDVDAGRHRRLALVLGNEGDGLSGHYVGSADLRVRIPMRTGVDSLNVAAAAAVAIYALAVPE
ncbi:MAG TPA: RNA methyltransferase [Actinomycetota bacterium]|nr:RNA methyltransferase [Actinomycetota bacterium]